MATATSDLPWSEAKVIHQAEGALRLDSASPSPRPPDASEADLRPALGYALAVGAIASLIGRRPVLGHGARVTVRTTF